MSLKSGILPPKAVELATMQLAGLDSYWATLRSGLEGSVGRYWVNRSQPGHYRINTLWMWHIKSGIARNTRIGFSSILQQEPVQGVMGSAPPLSDPRCMHAF